MSIIYILIIIECHVYIVVLNVLYDDVYMYKSLQINVMFCSVLKQYCKTSVNHFYIEVHYLLSFRQS